MNLDPTATSAQRADLDAHGGTSLATRSRYSQSLAAAATSPNGPSPDLARTP